MRALGRGLLLLALAGVAYMAFWPVPAAPVAWQTPPAPGYVGVHAPNQRLAGLKFIPIGAEVGPEHLVLRDGKLYAAVASGKILRMNPDGSAQEVFVQTGGRVLGFDFDAQGRLIAADALKGLLSIGPDRQVRVLADQVDGDPIRYADAVVVARSGTIYFSDASTRFHPKVNGTFEASVLDIIEQSSTGRILAYDPASGKTRIVARGFSFANGVALSADEQTLFVNETGRYRVWAVSVAAQQLDVAASPPPAQARVLLDNLPGYPDNLMRGSDGRIWLGFAKPRSATVDQLADKPFLRRMVLRLPRALWPVPRPYGHVIAFTEDGKIVADLQDPSGAYPETTSITETADRYYVQSLHAHAIGWLPK